MKLGSLVTLKDSGKLAKVIDIDNELIEVRLLNTNSTVLAHQSFFTLVSSKEGTEDENKTKVCT